MKPNIWSILDNKHLFLTLGNFKKKTKYLQNCFQTGLIHFGYTKTNQTQIWNHFVLTKKTLFLKIRSKIVMWEVKLARFRFKDGPFGEWRRVNFYFWFQKHVLKVKIKISKRLAKQLFVVSILAIYNFFGVFQKQTTRESKFLFF